MELKGEHQSIVDCSIGKGTSIWSHVNLYGCEIGEDCKVGSYVEVGRDVRIGDRCKIEAFAFIPTGVTIEDEVFIGPHAVFTNDRRPSATGEWEVLPTLVRKGASIGAGAVILCGITVGERAVVGAGSVVTRDVPDGTTVVGNPARPMEGRV